MKQPCSCSSSPTTCDWEDPSCERPRYFPRQLITPEDLTLAQDYQSRKRRIHNRFLHGYGVVCGLKVCRVPATDADGNEQNRARPWVVQIKPGYALDPSGNDILVDGCRTLDLRKEGGPGRAGQDPDAGEDPWCNEVPARREPGPVVIALRHKEVPKRPVRMQPTGCGCEENQCEYSRICDCYEFAVLDRCPEDHGEAPDLERLFRGPIPRCPPCPEHPWVALAVVHMTANGSIELIDNCSCRRLVASFASFWWRCGEAAQQDEVRLEAVAIDRPLLVAAEREVEITGRFAALPADSSLMVRPDPDLVGATITHVEEERLTALISVSADAQPGMRGLQLLAPDGAVLATLERAFAVVKEDANEEEDRPPGEDDPNRPVPDRPVPDRRATKPKKIRKKDRKREE